MAERLAIEGAHHTMKLLSSRSSSQPAPEPASQPQNGDVGTAKNSSGTLSQRGVFKGHESVESMDLMRT